MDRPALEPLALLDTIEQTLKVFFLPRPDTHTPSSAPRFPTSLPAQQQQQQNVCTMLCQHKAVARLVDACGAVSGHVAHRLWRSLPGDTQPLLLKHSLTSHPWALPKVTSFALPKVPSYRLKSRVDALRLRYRDVSVRELCTG
eukprot:1291657-Rhodomonas_salina.1